MAGTGGQWILGVAAIYAATLLWLPPDGFWVPDNGNKSIQVQTLIESGHPIYATAGTAELIRSAGLPVEPIEKRLSEGHPNVVDIIEDGTVGAVVNTVTGDRTTLQDGFDIRRTAAERRVPLFTSIDTARAAVESLSQGEQAYSVMRLDEYLDR